MLAGSLASTQAHAAPQVVHSNQTLDATRALAMAVVVDPAMQRQIERSLTDGAAAALQHAVVVERAKQAVRDVVGDASVQRSVGQGLWAAAGYSIAPRWLIGRATPSGEEAAGRPAGIAEARKGRGADDAAASPASNGVEPQRAEARAQVGIEEFDAALAGLGVATVGPA